MALINKLKAIGDAIRAKTGKTDELTLDQMVTEIEGIEGGGSGGAIAYYNEHIHEVPDCIFYSSPWLESVNCPNATSIGDSAFSDCVGLENVSFPLVETIEIDAFYHCVNLKTINFPKTTAVGITAFRECSNLGQVYLPEARTIKDGCFANCFRLAKVDLPKATTIEAQAFFYCVDLDTLILRTTEQVAIVDFSAVLSTKIMAGDGMPTGEGFVYIPTSMHDAYRAAYEPAFEAIGAAGLFDILFRKIEDYPEICGESAT